MRSYTIYRPSVQVERRCCVCYSVNAFDGLIKGTFLFTNAY